MEKLKTFEEFISDSNNMINERMDMNDPILIALRASKIAREKSMAEEKKRMAKRVYGKKREQLEDTLLDISQDLNDLYSERRSVLTDMEAEAGELGIEDFEAQGLHNNYGNELNRIDSEIESLIKKRREIEIKLAY
jgi:prefoldin subunit 5